VAKEKSAMKQIIILTVQLVTVAEEGQPAEQKLRVTAAFRFAVADVTHRVLRPDLTQSLYAPSPWNEIVELQSGAVVEQQASVLVSPTATPAQTRAALVASWAAANTAFQAEQPGRHYGAFYNGTWNAAS
jgi:hypothetical protein